VTGSHTKLRAFISSTMEDLGNERRAVVQQLRSMGIEPVNAEDMPPDGRSSWETIHAEIDQAHLFILILGDRYGWEPDIGYGAGSGLSVTHLELQVARAKSKLVLAFVKKLRYGAAVDVKRDAMRREVSDWANGVFRQEFDWADQLAGKVGESVTKLWTDALLKQLVRSADTTPVIQSPTPRPSSALAFPEPGTLTKVLLAGAGLSISAGYPTALLLMGIMANDLWGVQPESSELFRHSFSELAAFYEATRGRQALEQRIVQTLDTPHAVVPTPAHMRAVLAFRSIVTTNYDGLFERACELQGIAWRVVHPSDDVPHEPFEGLTLYKIVGSASAPQTLTLTTEDLRRAANGSVFARVKWLFEQNELVVIGHSLRDENVQQLLANRNPQREAIYVSPSTAITDEIVIAQYGLKRMHATADEFFGVSQSRLRE